MSSFHKIIPRHRFTVGFVHTPHFDKLYFQNLRSVLERHNLLNSEEYLVECNSPRMIRWRDQDRWLTLDEIYSDLESHDGDGFQWANAEGVMLPYLAAADHSDSWREAGALTAFENFPETLKLGSV